MRNVTKKNSKKDGWSFIIALWRFYRCVQCLSNFNDAKGEGRTRWLH